MAIIQIDDVWRIRGDDYQWSVERFKGVGRSGKFEGVEKWDAVAHHRTLDGCARSMAERRLRTADVIGVDEVIAEWRSITAEIDAAFAEWRAAA